MKFTKEPPILIMTNYVGDWSPSFIYGLLANGLHFDIHKLRDKKTNFMHLIYCSQYKELINIKKKSNIKIENKNITFTEPPSFHSPWNSFHLSDSRDQDPYLVYFSSCVVVPALLSSPPWFGEPSGSVTQQMETCSCIAWQIEPHNCFIKYSK